MIFSRFTFTMFNVEIMGVTRSYRKLQGVTGGNKGLQEVTRGYRKLQEVKGCYKGLQKTCFLSTTSPGSFSWSIWQENDS